MTEQLSSTNRLCPNCKTPLEPYAEVDIGVGVMQGGPWGCPACHWIEADPPLDATCNAMMGNAVCFQPAGHVGPHQFEEDFL